jgi:hypothetical protein
MDPTGTSQEVAEQRAEQMDLGETDESQDAEPRLPHIEGPVITISARIPRVLEDLFGWLGVLSLGIAAYLFAGAVGAFAVAGVCALAIAVLLEVST